MNVREPIIVAAGGGYPAGAFVDITIARRDIVPAMSPPERALAAMQAVRARQEHINADRAIWPRCIEATFTFTPSSSWQSCSCHNCA
jgi:hypothetical protein